MIPHNTKVRYFFNSFEQLKQEVDIINSKKTLYHQFQTKINFKNSDIKTITQRIEKKNIFNEFLNQIQDQEVRNILAKEFKNEFNHAN